MESRRSPAAFGLLEKALAANRVLRTAKEDLMKYKDFMRDTLRNHGAHEAAYEISGIFLQKEKALLHFAGAFYGICPL